MSVCFSIEVLSPTQATWQPYESIDDTLEGVKTYLFCMRKAFPNFSVRAIETTTGQVIQTLNSPFANE